ncbi:hypothetical protein GXP67_24635 [Rhodocytophaga rosea]|uniref:Uncharacterized protein n=1 Tax=Rhodocytophaga rosea TaxID=2704465 RepID=A0A6C0GNK0_9BACT|nr:hypothetical protein [Rhodocytophaga rosea]QHT69606.1 hypothetical protein GXP67_24635 [Rhodocytophaga rosea]
MKSMITFDGKFQKLGVILFLCISMLACQNSESTEMKQEQLNNNSSGMDQDHTAAPPDTLETPGMGNRDTTQLNNSTSTTDSVQQKF